MAGMIGRRIYPDENGLHFEQPGDYGCLEMNDHKLWYWRLPNWTGDEDNLASSVGLGVSGKVPEFYAGAHSVIEHEDGTITVSPSILWDSTHCILEKSWWHGYLERGIWRSC